MANNKKYKFLVKRTVPSHFKYYVKHIDDTREELYTNKEYSFITDDIVFVTSEIVNTKQIYETLGIEFFINDVKADEWEIAVPQAGAGKKVTDIANFNMDNNYTIEEKTRLLNALYKVEVARIEFKEK